MAAAIPEEWVKVNAVYYRRHEKPGSPDSMRVEYRSGLITYREWICFDHRGYPQERARKWWQRRMAGPGILPKSTAEAIAQSDSLLKPAEIKVRKNGKYTEITEFRFMPDLPSGRTGMDIRPSLSRAS
jgi:DNA repair protein RadD